LALWWEVHVTQRLGPDEAPAWVQRRLAGRSGTQWIGVDGFGAAGKTTLARRIVAELPGAHVIQVDDFARAGVRGWDRGLFGDQVLEPLLAGRPARYQRWDLVAETGLDWVEVPAGVPVVVEGVSATDERVPVPWDVTIWVATPARVRRRRIQTRDADPALLERWRTDWLPSEQAYAAAQHPWSHVDLIVRDIRIEPVASGGVVEKDGILMLTEGYDMSPEELRKFRLANQR
jgi:uridine kinase